MARLGCHCGADMTNTDGPSPHRLNVFKTVLNLLNIGTVLNVNAFMKYRPFHVAEYYVTSNMFLNQQRNVIWMVLRNYSFFGIKKWMIFSIWGMIIGLRIIFLN